MQEVRSQEGKGRRELSAQGTTSQVTQEEKGNSWDGVWKFLMKDQGLWSEGLTPGRDPKGESHPCLSSLIRAQREEDSGMSTNSEGNSL